MEDLAIAERAVATKENERRAIQAKLSSEADGRSICFKTSSHTDTR